MLEGRRVLITGGAGFVGWHLASRLVARNDVVVLDAFHDPVARGRPIPSGVRLVSGDALDSTTVESAMKGRDLVVHLASIVGVDTVGRDAVRTLTVSFDGTRTVLEAAARERVSRVIVSSTSELYGEEARAPDEDDPTPVPAPRRSRWSYAAGKLAADHLAIAFDRQSLVPTVVVRPFNIYGPHQAKGAIAEMVGGAVRDGRIRVHGSGSAVRAYCYVDDLLDALEAAAERPDASGEIFNVGDPATAMTTLALAEFVRERTGATASIEHGPRREAEVDVRVPRIDKAMRILGWRPRTPIAQGIDRVIAWARSAVA